MMITRLKGWLATAVLFMPVLCVQGQTNPTMTGEYYLRGVTEVASGFKLNADSTFQFFFSYGALDRYGAGSWSLKDGKLVLNSRSQPEKDFALVTSKAAPGNLTTIRIIENNQMLLPYVQGKVHSGVQEDTVVTDKKGMITFPKKAIDSLSLWFEFCPERYSTFTFSDPTHNYLEFRFEPWLLEVFFSNFSLSVDKEGLYGKHPLMEGVQHRYNK